MSNDRDIGSLLQQLRESEERYRAVVSQALEGIFLFDLETLQILEANAAFQNMLGYTSQEITALTLYDVMAHKRADIDQHRQQLLARRQHHLWTRSYRRKDGSLLDVEVDSSVITFGGRETGCAINRDITERKRAEEALRDSEDRYRDLVESSPVIIILHDLQGQVISANPAAAELLGYTTGEIARMNIRDGLARQARDQLGTYLATVQQNGYASGLMRVQTRAGETRILEFTSTLRTEGVATPIVRAMARDVTELKRAERAQARLARQMSALYETSLEINSQTDLPQLLATIIQRSANLLGARIGLLYLMQPDNATLKLIASHNLLGGYAGVTLRLGEGLAGRVAQTGNPLMIENHSQWEDRAEVFADSPFRRVLGVPLKSGNRVIGVLNFSDVDKTGAYQEDEIQLACLFADQAAIAIENARLLAEAKQRAKEFAALYETTRDLATQWHLPTLLETIALRATNLLNASGGGVLLHDQLRNNLELAIAKGNTTSADKHFNLTEEIAGHVAHTRQPVIVNDYSTWEHRHPEYEGVPFPAILQVPMLYGGELIGVLNVSEINNAAHRFTDDDARLLSLFAAQAASAVHNARLVAETKQQADEFAVLYETARDLATQNDLNALLRTIVMRATTLLKSIAGAIFLYDAARGDLELAIATTDAVAPQVRLKLGEGMAGRVAQTHQPLIVDDYSTWEHRRPEYASTPFGAVLQVPMLFGGELIGVLDVSEMGESTRKFTEADARLMSLFAAQAASAVYNARLLRQTQQRAEQLALLYDAALTLNRAIEPRQVIEHLLAITHQSVHAARADFYRYNPIQRSLVFESSSGYALDLVATLRALQFAEGEPRGLVGLVAQERTPLYLPDTTADPRWIPIDATIRSGYWVPVEREQQLYGVLTVSSPDPDAFTPADQRLVMLFANQVAVALERAHLFQAEQNRRAELTALYDLSRALSDTDALDAILNLVVQSAVATIQITFARVALIEGDTLVVQTAQQIRNLDRALSIAGHAALTDLPICQRALEQDEITLLHATPSDVGMTEREFLLLDPAKTLCLVPLRAGGHALGLLMLGEVRDPEREPFTAEQMRLARSIGDQAASAIRRTKLREQIEHRLSQVQALHTIDLTITGSLDLNVTLDVLLTQIATQLSAAAAAILRFKPHAQMLEYLAGHGFRSKAIESSQLRLGAEYAGRAALERRIVNEPDLPAQRATLLRSFLCADEGFVSCVCVPLIAKGQIKGVLEIFFRAPFHPDSDWLELVETLGTQAAIAIDNADLFDNLQRSNLELALAYNATITGWARTLELREPAHAGRTPRVTELTIRLARALGIREPELIHLRHGALLHDVGMLSIPDAIWRKRGALTPKEKKIVRQHPHHASEILSSSPYLHPILDIPYCHHERWDGRGYPRGLVGEQIPLAARIFAVADAWDALTVGESGQPGQTHKQARAYLRKMAGKIFDPRVVETFLPITEEINED